MPAILVSSLAPIEGRTTVTAALGALLAERGHAVRLARLRSGDEQPAAAEDDARALAAVPGCSAPRAALSEQEALPATREAGGDELCLFEAPPGAPDALARGLEAKVLLVTSQTDDLRLGDAAAAAGHLGDALIGVVAVRQPPRKLDPIRAAFGKRGLRCIAVLPEDRLLAGPSVREIAEALRASRLYENAPEDEALEYVMLGPITSDPGQPYFLRHGRKAVVNRFDKMDLHLAALATEPECLVLTGGQQPSPYLMDRVGGSGLELTVLLAPERTVPTAQALEELYARTRFAGSRKLERASELLRAALSDEAVSAIIS